MLVKYKTSSVMTGLLILSFLTFGCSQDSTENTAKSDSQSSKSTASTTKPAAPEPVTPAASAKKAVDEDAKDATPAEPIAAENFPKPDNAEKPMYTSETSTVMFHQEGTVENQVKFYTEQLEKLRWKKAPTSEVVDGVAFLDFGRGDLVITMHMVS